MLVLVLVDVVVVVVGVAREEVDVKYEGAPRSNDGKHAAKKLEQIANIGNLKEERRRGIVEKDALQCTHVGLADSSLFLSFWL
jgi:hypothetical protein